MIDSHVASVSCESSEIDHLVCSLNLTGPGCPSNGPPIASPITPPMMQPTARSRIPCDFTISDKESQAVKEIGNNSRADFLYMVPVMPFRMKSAVFAQVCVFQI